MPALRRLTFILALVFLPAIAHAETRPATIVAFGDSLTAGYGVTKNESWPSVLARRLQSAGQNIRIVNAGVSGDTTAGGRARLAWSLSGAEGAPDIVIVALGGNDALRGLMPQQVRQNLDVILTELNKKSIRVLLAGMLAPPNLGAEYARAFRALYQDLAAKHKVALYPFILDGVAADPALNQPDGIHPNAQGHAIIAARIEPYVRALLAK